MLAHFLYRDQIRHLQTRGLWPAELSTGIGSDRVESANGGYGDMDLQENTNHRWRDEERLLPPSSDEDGSGEEECGGGDYENEEAGHAGEGLKT